jgi:hypothetical protein
VREKETKRENERERERDKRDGVTERDRVETHTEKE